MFPNQDPWIKSSESSRASAAILLNCDCRAWRRVRRREKHIAGVTLFDVEDETSRHYSFCRWYAEATTSRKRTIGARFDTAFKTLARTVTATVSFAQGFGQWAVTPGLVLVAAVDEKLHPGYRLVSQIMILPCQFPFPMRPRGLFQFEEINTFFARGIDRLRKMVVEGHLSLDVRSSSNGLDINQYTIRSVSLYPGLSHNINGISC